LNRKGAYVTAQATSKDYDRRSEALWASLDDRDE
jgi:hypothetical protein